MESMRPGQGVKWDILIFYQQMLIRRLKRQIKSLNLCRLSCWQVNPAILGCNSYSLWLARRVVILVKERLHPGAPLLFERGLPIDASK